MIYLNSYYLGYFRATKQQDIDELNRMLESDDDVTSNGNYNTTQSVIQNNTTPFVPQVTSLFLWVIGMIFIVLHQPMVNFATSL